MNKISPKSWLIYAKTRSSEENYRLFSSQRQDSSRLPQYKSMKRYLSKLKFTCSKRLTKTTTSIRKAWRVSDHRGIEKRMCIASSTKSQISVRGVRGPGLMTGGYQWRWKNFKTKCTVLKGSRVPSKPSSIHVRVVKITRSSNKWYRSRRKSKKPSASKWNKRTKKSPRKSSSSTTESLISKKMFIRFTTNSAWLTKA